VATSFDEFPERDAESASRSGAHPTDELDPDGDLEPLSDPPGAVSPRRRLGIGAAIILVLAALAVTIVIGVVRTGNGEAASTPATATRPAAAPTSGADTGQRVYVDVTGAVRSPGMFVLSKDARVLDAISAAGGFAPKASREAVNLARPLTDGEQLVVPEVGAAPSPAAGAAPDAAAATGSGTSPGGTASGAKINLNTATQSELEQLPRIGPAMAQRILQWRTDNGRFTSVDDLLAVSGIGDKMLAALRDRVTV
jgi:competence protein ComEA